MGIPHFRVMFYNLVHARHFQFATHTWLYVHKVNNAICCKTAAYPSLLCTSQVIKQVFTIVCKLFPQIGVEFILKWLPSSKNQGQTHQQKESDTSISTDNC
jgi:hypothetical protein